MSQSWIVKIASSLAVASAGVLALAGVSYAESDTSATISNTQISSVEVTNNDSTSITNSSLEIIQTEQHTSQGLVNSNSVQTSTNQTGEAVTIIQTSDEKTTTTLTELSSSNSPITNTENTESYLGVYKPFITEHPSNALPIVAIAQKIINARNNEHNNSSNLPLDLAPTSNPIAQSSPSGIPTDSQSPAGILHQLSQVLALTLVEPFAKQFHMESISVPLPISVEIILLVICFGVTIFIAYLLKSGNSFGPRGAPIAAPYFATPLKMSFITAAMHR